MEVFQPGVSVTFDSWRSLDARRPRVALSAVSAGIALGPAGPFRPWSSRGSRGSFNGLTGFTALRAHRLQELRQLIWWRCVIVEITEHWRMHTGAYDEKSTFTWASLQYENRLSTFTQSIFICIVLHYKWFIHAFKCNHIFNQNVNLLVKQQTLCRSIQACI